MDNKYKGLRENLDRFKNDLSDEKTRLLFKIAYKQGYDQALSLGAVVGQSEQLFCHHEGKYTLKSDGNCCKCHLPPNPKAK